MWLARLGGREGGRESETILLSLQALPEEKQSELVARELWIEANFTAYKAEQEDEMKTKLANSGKYKMYRLVHFISILFVA